MKVTFKIDILGFLPNIKEIRNIKKWDSELFEIKGVDEYPITAQSDGPGWEYTDANIEQLLRNNDGADILLTVTNVPLQNNYYARVYPNNRICISYFGMSEILNSYDIPLKNLLLKVLYTSSFVYRKLGNSISSPEVADVTHHDTRGCIFDFNGANKADIIYSTNKPKICDPCVHSLTNNNIANNIVERNLINKVRLELKKIDKNLYYKIVDWVKKRPIVALIISAAFAIVLDLIGHYLYDQFKPFLHL